MEELKASVVIPTYNRIDSLRRLLESLDQQTMEPGCFEVVVVDDGSIYDPAEITDQPYRFALTYLRQENRGATVARNYGAQQTRGQVLVFIDDDIVISEKALEALFAECTRTPKVVAVGKLIACNINLTSSFTKLAIEDENKRGKVDSTANEPLSFVKCNTQLLAVKKTDFIDIGMLQDPTGGWPNWDDVDFGYRSYLAGFQLLRVADAIGEHWDYSLSSLKSATRRWYRASQSAVRLFQKYPDLRQYIPMFNDITPINWRQDPSSLIVRKCLRKMVSSKFMLSLMEGIVVLFDHYYPSPGALRPLYRWIEGAYKYQGYRQGLREFGSVPEPGSSGLPWVGNRL